MFTLKQQNLSVDEVRRLWNEWVDQYSDPLASVGRPANPALMDAVVLDVIQKLSLKPEDSLLDVGCGSGFMLNEIAKRIPLKAFGADISEKQIQIAQTFFPGISFTAAPIESLPFPDASFNKILCYSTLAYSSDWKKSVNEVLRVCQSDGLILLADLPIRHLRLHYYGSVLASIPAVLMNWKRLYKALTWKQKDCPWNWTRLKDLESYIESCGYRLQVLSQPEHRQYACVSHKYRRDVLVSKIFKINS